MMKSIVHITSYNLNLDRRERQWLDFTLFSGLFVQLHKQAVPQYNRFFTYWEHSTGNNVIGLFRGRISVAWSRKSVSK